MRILLVAPSFFGYRKLVSDELARQGHFVECVDDRPSESIAFKSFAKISYNLVDRMIGIYAEKVGGFVASGGYDLVLFMGGMSFCFTPEQLSSIREKSDARFIVYLWDSFANCQRIGRCVHLFDEVYSFEPNDCERHGFILRPLFYSDLYERVPLIPEEGFLYDACFVGSVHQESKFEAVLAICEELESRGMRVFKYFYMPSSSAERFRKATNSLYKGHKFELTSLSSEQVAGIYASSKAVIDSPQFGQDGLTMRTLETVGAKRKLVTANADVLSYDFATFGNVAVWHPGSVFDEEFFETPYRELPEGIYESYSLASFVRNLLGEGFAYHGYEACL